MTYFDHNASSPLLPEARKAWLDASNLYPGNPSSPHSFGLRAEKALTEARKKLAKILGCDPGQIVWTSSATEANNLVLHHLWREHGRERIAWVSAIEHPSVLETAKHYFGSRVGIIPVSREGIVDLAWLSHYVKSFQSVVVAVMAANNETGVLQPWRKLSRLCQEVGVPFLCDATQWFGKLPARGLGKIDFVTGSAHKFGGPRGVGFAKCPSGSIQPLICGGGQEDGRRAGTENVQGIVSMIRALEIREKDLKRAKPSSKTQNRFETRLLEVLPDCEIVGGGTNRLWNTVMALMPKSRINWLEKLNQMGFPVSAGSACASGNEHPSHVLSAMGYSPEQASRAVRFSGSRETKESDWNKLLSAIEKLAKRMNSQKA
jgi:cysteine desulfurase